MRRDDCACAMAVAAMLHATASASAAQTSAAPPARVELRADAIARVARARASAVVAVHTRSTALELRGPRLDWMVSEGLASGVVIDAGGLILTNAHVIDGASDVHVRTPDGDDVPVSLVGADPELDLALLQASDPTGLRAAPFGDSDRLQVGEWVVAIGNPFGLHHTVTAGIVSAKARTIDDSGVEYLQTDAAVSPGNSGGPLFDLAGRIVGINVGMLSAGGQNVGLNLAIPSTLLREILPQLRAGGVAHGWLGVAVAPLSARGAHARRLTAGLVVIGVTEGGPAAQAGLRPGDVVLAFADEPAAGLRDFYRRIRARTAGSVVRFRVWRDTDERTVDVEVGRRPLNP